MQQAKSTLGEKLKSRWKLMLLALPFTAVGIGFLLLSVLPALKDARQMQHWQQGQAQITSAGVKVNRGDDATTYKAFATYRYSFAGGQYTGSRVAIDSSADNIGDFQQQLGHQLERAQREGRTVNVYINPDDPAQAVLNRELRWELLVFKMVFVLVFGGIGLGILLYALLAPLDTLKTAGADKPWLTRRDWASPDIKCNGKVLLWGSLGFAVFWNLIAIPVGIKCVEEFTEGNTAALIGLLFPLVGAGLVVWAVKEWRAYKRFGPAPLQMDPYPGSIGGQVGGVIEVTLPYDNTVGFVTKLGCFEVYYTRSGKERKRHEKLLWQSEGFATTRATGISANKTRLEILFNVPENLPPSQVPSNRYHLWRLTVTADLPGADFNRSYELPVFATGASATYLDSLSGDNPLQQEFSEKAIEEVLDVRQIPGGVELDNPAFRRPGGKLVGLLVGAVFTGAGIVMWQQKAPLLFTLIVFLIGASATIFCLYSLILRLRVKLDTAGLHVRKSLLGLPAGSRQVHRSDIAALPIK
ncbi:MAG TPA: DUF3592 domain-containing protein, partial [Cellvibrionaceae bacterium]